MEKRLTYAQERKLVVDESDLQDARNECGGHIDLIQLVEEFFRGTAQTRSLTKGELVDFCQVNIRPLVLIRSSTADLTSVCRRFNIDEPTANVLLMAQRLQQIECEFERTKGQIRTLHALCQKKGSSNFFAGMVIGGMVF